MLLSLLLVTFYLVVVTKYSSEATEGYYWVCVVRVGGFFHISSQNQPQLRLSLCWVVTISPCLVMGGLTELMWSKDWRKQLQVTNKLSHSLWLISSDDQEGFLSRSTALRFLGLTKNISSFSQKTASGSIYFYPIIKIWSYISYFSNPWLEEFWQWRFNCTFQKNNSIVRSCSG